MHTYMLPCWCCAMLSLLRYARLYGAALTPPTSHAPRAMPPKIERGNVIENTPHIQAEGRLRRLTPMPHKTGGRRSSPPACCPARAHPLPSLCPSRRGVRVRQRATCAVSACCRAARRQAQGVCENAGSRLFNQRHVAAAAACA